MLRVSSLSCAVAGRDLFKDLSFIVNDGQRLGIVGPNGCGKTTLLRIIAGELRPQTGSVELTGGLAVRLVQGVEASAATAGDTFPALYGTDAASDRLAALAESMASGDGDPELLADEYERALAALEAGSAAPAPVADPGIEPGRRLDSLSGGQLERLAILDVLARQPGCLLLDEPTNHLDMDTVRWLESVLRDFPGPVVLVSHDRAFLDAVATHVLTLDPAAGQPLLTTGGYSAAREALELRRARQWDAFERQQKQERALRREISAIESRARGIENRTIHFYFRKRAAKVARRAVTLRSRLERELESESRAEKPPPPSRGIQASFASAPASASALAVVDALGLDAGARPLLRDITFRVARGDRIALTGPNGSGKSTLLRAILGEVAPVAGSARLAGSTVPGYLPQDDAVDVFAGESAGITPLDWIRREAALPEREAGNELHRYLGSHEALSTPIGRLSYGERRRLALARLIIRGANLLLLDEPTNHLDLPAREEFEDVLAGFEGAVIAASHDRFFVEQWAQRVIHIEDGVMAER